MFDNNEELQSQEIQLRINLPFHVDPTGFICPIEKSEDYELSIYPYRNAVQEPGCPYPTTKTLNLCAKELMAAKKTQKAWTMCHVHSDNFCPSLATATSGKGGGYNDMDDDDEPLLGCKLHAKTILVIDVFN